MGEPISVRILTRDSRAHSNTVISEDAPLLPLHAVRERRMDGDHENDLLPARPHKLWATTPRRRGAAAWMFAGGTGDVFKTGREREQKEWRELSGLIQENDADGLRAENLMRETCLPSRAAARATSKRETHRAATMRETDNKQFAVSPTRYSSRATPPQAMEVTFGLVTFICGTAGPGGEGRQQGRREGAAPPFWPRREKEREEQ